MNNNISKNKTLKNIAGLIVVAMFFSGDQILKSFARAQGQNTSFPLLGDWLRFHFVPNPYIAFSLPLGGMLLNLIITLIVLGLILGIIYLILQKKQQKALIIPLTFILFGAISNLLDRLLFGAVIDYLDLKYFTIFNLGDVMISLGVIFYFCTFKKRK